jgi:nucleoside-diphosphate-sugar epimerase
VPELVILGRGFLGRRFASAFTGSVLLPTDICDPEALARAFAENKPSVVINAAGKTARPNVDCCELHQSETYRANVIGALQVAGAAADAGAHLIHIGSGCISNTQLASPRPEGLGIRLRPIREALRETMRIYARAVGSEERGRSSFQSTASEGEIEPRRANGRILRISPNVSGEIGPL